MVYDFAISYTVYTATYPIRNGGYNILSNDISIRLQAFIQSAIISPVNMSAQFNTIFFSKSCEQRNSLASNTRI